MISEMNKVEFTADMTYGKRAQNYLTFQNKDLRSLYGSLCVCSESKINQNNLYALQFVKLFLIVKNMSTSLFFVNA